MPTLLSRLRPYRFLKRGEEKEAEVIRRVFRDTREAGLASYLDSFLPRSNEKLYPQAAFFIAFLARSVGMALRKQGIAELPAELAALGSYCPPIAEAAGFQKAHSAGEVISRLFAEGDFQADSFPRFLSLSLGLVSESLRKAGANSLSIKYYDMWRRNSAQAAAAEGVWNQNPALVLEAFFYRMKNALKGC
jgi:DNA polymerase-3 subunit gamma/tau